MWTRTSSRAFGGAGMGSPLWQHPIVGGEEPGLFRVPWSKSRNVIQRVHRLCVVTKHESNIGSLFQIGVILWIAIAHPVLVSVRVALLFASCHHIPREIHGVDGPCLTSSHMRKAGLLGQNVHSRPRSRGGSEGGYSQCVVEARLQFPLPCAVRSFIRKHIVPLPRRGLAGRSERWLFRESSSVGPTLDHNLGDRCRRIHGQSEDHGASLV
mmetsp:Transcript_7373/g.17473  ORF Transcript_7373/g.17473 Transcript_7373/m.17473 type:complete len:211 (-) Transcript_7373:520-1152(-)